MTRLHADLALLLTAMIWGLAFVFQKSAMSHIGPLTFIAARAAVAALALTPFALWEAHAPRTERTGPVWPIAACGGVAFFAAAVLQQTGLVTATVTNTGFLTALYVVVTPFVVWAWSGAPPRAIVWPAVALSAVGTWLLGGGELASFSRGDALVALSAIFWAVHVVITGRGSRYRRPLAFTAVQFAVVAALAAVSAGLFEEVSPAGLRAAAPDIAFVGLLSSALTFTVLTFALQYAPPAEAAVIVSMETVFAAIAAYLILGERLMNIGWFGAAMMLLATLIIQLRAQPTRKPASS
ncbi:MAG TPA: DMT family transporter [Hyphomicrobiaceae bacterium]|nr:DMT family transporter [Hyphomicrobiaceae bacterium]